MTSGGGTAMTWRFIVLYYLEQYNTIQYNRYNTFIARVSAGVVLHGCDNSMIRNM